MADSSQPYREVRYELSRDFLRILEHLQASLLVSTYQAGKLVAVGCVQGELRLSFHNFEQAMGIAIGGERIAVGARGQIWFLHHVSELAQAAAGGQPADACFVARRSLVTGNIHGHELAWAGEQLWVVNTLFSCLCTLHDEYSFVPRWQPPFIKELAAEDRCHLNGLGMAHGKPAIVTVMAESNTPAGWRPTKATSGCVLDVPSGETIARGLAMPHSPRLHDGKLWVLDSGTGRLATIDRPTGKVQTVCAMPAYTRGLAFGGQFAFVGMSKIRETAVFGGVPIAENRANLKCGIAVVDLLSGQAVAYLQFLSGVDEIFDVQVLPRVRFPCISGPFPQQDDAQDIWIVPPAGQLP